MSREKFFGLSLFSPAIRVLLCLPSAVRLLFFLSLASGTAVAADWYVRPVGGDYVSQDGRSYRDAWNGLEAIVWGAGGVSAGDTLYVCGTHIRTATSYANIALQGWFMPRASGREGSAITIKGCTGDHAVIWGA